MLAHAAKGSAGNDVCAMQSAVPHWKGAHSPKPGSSISATRYHSHVCETRLFKAVNFAQQALLQHSNLRMLRSELSRIFEGVDGIGVFVAPDRLDSGKAQRESTGVARARLD